MKKHERLFEKMFGGFSVGSSRVPLRSNVFNSGSGYSRIGSTGGGRFGTSLRQSPLLGNASPSNLLSGYYERVDELRSYQLLDVIKLATNFFSDYIVNYLGEGQSAVTILTEDRSVTDEAKTEKLNDILLNDLKIYDYIRSHIKDTVFYGSYTSMLMSTRDEFGHLKFRFEEINDPTSVVLKKTRDKEGSISNTYITRGSDNKLYEIKSESAFMLGSVNLRLENDLDESWETKAYVKPSIGINDSSKCLDKVLRSNSYLSGEPLFYSLVLKVKELVIKELLISLISLRDLSSVQLFLLQFDKQTPLETANELCARATKLANNTNELATFLTSQFDAISFIENTLSQPAKFLPDFNATIGNKNSMLPLDKLSDKLLDLMQNLDSCRNNVLSPLGIPATILDSTSGSKWQILQQSERANSRVAGFMTGIKESVTRLVCDIYKTVYNEDLDPNLVQLHISEKTSVEYNNQLNQGESIGNLVNNITSIVSNALQVLDSSAPLIDTKAYLSYIQGLIKDIDPDTEALITEETIDKYTALAKSKLKAMLEQQGISDEVLTSLEEK